MSARLRGAWAIPLALGFAVLGSTAVVPPAAAAAPVAQLGVLADQLCDVVDVAQRGGGGRSFSAPSRSSGGGGRSFSGGGGRSFSGGGGRSAGGGRSFSGNRSISGTRSVSRGNTRGVTGTRSAHGTRGVTGTRSAHGTRGATGTRSAHGTRGATGTRSTQGTRGLTGTRGATGTHGLTGTRGATGTHGPGGLTSTRGHSLTSGPGHVGTRTGLSGNRMGHGPGHIASGPGHGSRMAGFTRIHNRDVRVFRDRRWTWWGGSWRVWAPITALAGLYIGSDYLWPDAYVSVAQPACVGVTESGCRLRWQSVPFEEGGGGDVQCVQYCPRVGVAPPAPPPVAAVGAALPPAPPAPPVAAVGSPAPAGQCELTIFSDRNFAGMSAPTSEDQPRLVDVGWKNEIASMQITGGTWDFFSEDDFSGESMRLPPGRYDNLGDKWTKRISSFTCVQ